MEMIVHCIERIADKIAAAFSSAAGWILSLGVSFVTFLGPEKNAFIAVGITVLWDMFWGIFSALRQRRFFLSALVRDTARKLFIYYGLLSLLLFVERSLSVEWGLATRVICTIAAVAELWSSCASILIIQPRCPLIRLFKHYLEGEIASKLNCSPEEVKNILNDE